MRKLVVLLALTLGGAGTGLLVSGSAAEEGNVNGGAEPATAAYDCGPVDFDHYDAGSEVEGFRKTETFRQCEDAGAPTRINTVTAVYGSCAAHGDAGCAPPVQISSSPACERNLALYEKYPGPPGAPRVEYRRTSLRGLPAAIFDSGRRIEIYTGDATIVVYGENKGLTRAAAIRLSGVGHGRPIGMTEDLPAPVDGALEGELTCP